VLSAFEAGFGMADAAAESTSPAARECVEKQRLLRMKLARIRLRRVEIQRKQWKVAELREKWLCSLQGIQFERSLVQVSPPPPLLRRYSRCRRHG
jgi:hypothetical protein